MARALTLLLAVLFATRAQSACVIDANAEIVNPFEPGCGDVILTYTQSDDTGDNVALGYPVPMPLASLTPIEGFRDYDSLFARHQSLVTLHDEVAGHVVGQSVAGRDIWAYVIGDEDALTAEGASEGAVLVNGGIHAREWQTPEAVTAVLEMLIERKEESFERYLIENLTTVLLPVHNVDGFLQTQRFADRTSAHRDQPREGRMRRKNLRHPDTQGAIDSELASSADNFFGVDLNRNAAQGFAQAGRSQSSTTSLVYHGAALGAGNPCARERGGTRARFTPAPVQRHAFVFADPLRADDWQHAPRCDHGRAFGAHARGIRPALPLLRRSARLDRHRHDGRSLRLHVSNSRVDLRARTAERRPGLRRAREPRTQRLHLAGARSATHARRRGADVSARLLQAERAARGARRANT